MAKYDLRQQVFCISWMSGIANNRTANREKLQNFANHHIQAILTDSKVRQLIGEWQIVWGPAIYQSNVSSCADNTMYIAKTAPNIYVIGVAGSNGKSKWIDWLHENLRVEQTVQCPL